MTALIINDLSKFPLLNSEGDSFWNPIKDANGKYFLQNTLDAKKDLDKEGIEYTIGEVEIKQEWMNY